MAGVLVAGTNGIIISAAQEVLGGLELTYQGTEVSLQPLGVGVTRDAEPLTPIVPARMARATRTARLPSAVWTPPPRPDRPAARTSTRQSS